MQDKVGSGHADEEQPEEKRWDDRVQDLRERLNYEQHQSPSSSVNYSPEVELDKGVTYFARGDYWGFQKWQLDSLDSDLHSLADKEKQARLQMQQDEEEEMATATPPEHLHAVDSEHEMSLEQEQPACDSLGEVCK